VRRRGAIHTHQDGTGRVGPTADDHHRARRVQRHLLTDRTDDQPGQTTPAVAADHEN
jgi:hypothetical protein